MNESQKRLRNMQAVTLSGAARKALDEARPIDALSLLEKEQGFLKENLITLMGVLCTHPSREVESWALKLLKDHLARCSEPTELLPASHWVSNPKRVSFLPGTLRTLIDGKRRELQPEWNGVWENPGKAGSKVALECSKKNPREVHDPELCLDVAAQVGDWGRWMERYINLGGDPKNPKYVKIRIAKAAVKVEWLSPELKELVRLYTEIAKIYDVRKFLRKLTPTKPSASGLLLNQELTRHALLVYCSCTRLEYTLEDWLHIASSAIFLKERTVQRISQRALAGMHRTPRGHQIFNSLRAINGDIPVTPVVRDDIGWGSNPIWQMIYTLTPVDANARAILHSYSGAEILRS